MAVSEQPNNSEQSRGRAIDVAWLAACAVVTLVAAFLRFYRLDLKPLHHDEGVNGFFLTTLFRDGVYKYDPANYHGPTLYYIALSFAKAFGLETVPVRASVAIFGVLTVILIFFLHRYIGRAGALLAALFVALSPGMSFISRYFIHESLFVFLSLAIVVAVVMFVDRKRAGPLAIASALLLLLVCFVPTTLNLADYLGGKNTTAVWLFRGGFFLLELGLAILVVRMLIAWNAGRPIYLLLAAACAALLFATKETAFITLGTMAIAVGCVWLWRRLIKGAAPADAHDTGTIDDASLRWTNFRLAFGPRLDTTLLTIAAATVFIYIGVLFFSSFFTNWPGVSAAFEAYALWTKTGSKDHTQNGFFAYLKWGIESEAPIFILAALGALIAFARARHRFAMFAALWAFGLLAAYSLIPYKTPWLALSFIMPMCIAAGYGVGQMIGHKAAAVRAAGIALGAIAALWLGYQAYDANFVRYDDEDATYVYAHTKRGFLDLVAEINRYAEKSGKGNGAKIDIVSPDYWPLPWYLNTFKQANFFGSLVDAEGADMIVAKKGEQDAEVIKRYSSRFKYVGIFPLRPGVDLVLLVRRETAGADGAELYRLQTETR